MLVAMGRVCQQPPTGTRSRWASCSTPAWSSPRRRREEYW